MSFTITLIVNWFLNRDFHPGRDFDGATGVLRSISAFDLIVLTMVVALALFHYWRFQDAAASSADERERQRVSGATSAPCSASSRRSSERWQRVSSSQ